MRACVHREAAERRADETAEPEKVTARDHQSHQAERRRRSAQRRDRNTNGGRRHDDEHQEQHADDGGVDGGRGEDPPVRIGC